MSYRPFPVPEQGFLHLMSWSKLCASVHMDACEHSPGIQLLVFALQHCIPITHLPSPVHQKLTETAFKYSHRPVVPSREVCYQVIRRSGALGSSRFTSAMQFVPDLLNSKHNARGSQNIRRWALTHPKLSPYLTCWKDKLIMKDLSSCPCSFDSLDIW